MNRHYQVQAKREKAYGHVYRHLESSTAININPSQANLVFCYAVALAVPVFHSKTNLKMQTAVLMMFNFTLSRSHNKMATAKYLHSLVINARERPARFCVALFNFLAFVAVIVIGHLNLDPNLTMVTIS